MVSGVSSREHLHMFAEILPHIGVSDVVRRVKRRSAHRLQIEFPDLRKRTWGRHFWAPSRSSRKPIALGFCFEPHPNRFALSKCK
ncbi:MAG: transposase [Methylocella sp.]